LEVQSVFSGSHPKETPVRYPLLGRNGLTLGICVALFTVVMGALAFEAFRKHTAPFNEPLWFMRARVLPTELSTPDHRLWAIDVPALNRWLYWPVLKLTGLDSIPPGEPICWELKDDGLYFQGERGPDAWVPAKPEHKSNEYIRSFYGEYAPRRGILALRMVNLAAFGCMLLFLWLTARMVTGSDILAAATVAPFCTLHFWITTVAFVSMSGDTFMLAGFALALFLWTRFHLQGRGVSWKSVILVGVAAGVTTSAKHPGVIVVGAFALYLLWYSRGWDRLLKPAIAAAVALGVFVLVNPAVLTYPGARPWEVLQLMMNRRDVVADEGMTRHGGVGLSEIWRRVFFWVPLVPAAFVGVLAVRRERWLVPVGIWCASITVVTTLQLIRLGILEARYAAPIEMAVYFTLALIAMAYVARDSETDRIGAQQGIHYFEAPG
jgi:hypothetical protein